MVKKKSWIDKKKAVRYTLVYRSTEDHDDEPLREFVETDKLGTADDATPSTSTRGRYPPGHPLAFLNEQEPLTEERRREIIALGFPDDGYDYLKHLRRRGAPVSASVERSTVGGVEGVEGAECTTPSGTAAATGPSMYMPAPTFVPPTPDVRLVDARAMRLTRGAADEAEADDRLFTVTAYSREVEGVHVQRELEELEEYMDQFEDVSVTSDADTQGGVGDLQDDFVLAAMAEGMGGEMGGGMGGGMGGNTQQQLQQQARARGGGGHGYEEEEEGGCEEYEGHGEEEEEYSIGSNFDDEEEEEEEEEGLDGMGGGVLHRGQHDGEQRSIASTYWRPERHDRNDALSIIDERFERLALEYDEDEIGELDEEADAIRGEGDAVQDFGKVLDKFLDTHNSRRTRLEWPAGVVGEGSDGDGGGGQGGSMGVGVVDEEEVQRLMAVQKAREYGHACEATTAAHHGEGEGEGEGDAPPQPAVFRPATKQRQWDCESVLSLLSNTDNHPGRIAEPGRPRRGRGDERQGDHRIQLSDRGIPVGYQSTRTPAAPTAPATPRPAAPAAVPRAKDETPEEKKARKAAVKEAKRASREVKKEFKKVFREEHVKQQARAASNPSASVVPIG